MHHNEIEAGYILQDRRRHSMHTSASLQPQETSRFMFLMLRQLQFTEDVPQRDKWIDAPQDIVDLVKLFNTAAWRLSDEEIDLACIMHNFLCIDE